MVISNKKYWSTEIFCIFHCRWIRFHGMILNVFLKSCDEILVSWDEVIYSCVECWTLEHMWCSHQILFWIFELISWSIELMGWSFDHMWWTHQIMYWIFELMSSSIELIHLKDEIIEKSKGKQSLKNKIYKELCKKIVG